ncbi:MAG: hypothetical protein K8I00_05675, partial [Candidatus Omnitrophica bacterium]|nr:hypothetical protein [Candidatus Omnitrophota bacterium]
MISPRDRIEEDPSAEINFNYEPLPGSQKIYKLGTLFPDIRVPVRQISLSPTVDPHNNSTPNKPVELYDTSGPYTDPQVPIDIRTGLKELRGDWILNRNDVEQLAESTSQYRKQREQDLKLSEMRYPLIRQPYRAKSGSIVTQLHYARKGMITPEMEFIAIRENQQQALTEFAGNDLLTKQHPGQNFGAATQKL